MVPADNPEDAADTGSGATGAPDRTTAELRKVLVKIQALKNYAINRGMDVGNDLLESLAALEAAFEDGTLKTRRAEIDQALAAMTAITYPVTIENIFGDGTVESPGYTRFKQLLGWFGGLGVSGAIAWYVVRSVGPVTGIPPTLSESLLAMSLGFLGAVVYTLYQVVELPGETFRTSDEFAGYSRLVLGALLGWVFFFFFQIEFQSNFPGKEDPATEAGATAQSIYLFIPFLAGYSSKFAMSILNKTITALELTIGIEDARDPSIANRKRARKIQGKTTL